MLDTGSPIPGALLWDLDNVAPCDRLLPSLARALREFADTAGPMIASGQARVAARCRPLLEDLGFQVLSGGRRPQGADRQLMRRARALHRGGVGRFFVASNDRGFAGLGHTGQVTVLTLSPGLVSQKLRRAACEVVEMTWDRGAWTMRRSVF